MASDLIVYESNEDLKLLYEIREKLSKYNNLKDQEFLLKRKEKDYNKQLKEVLNRRDLDKEHTINAQRNDIIHKYDYQIYELHENIKETQEKKKYEKKERIKKRIETETQRYQQEIQEQKEKLNRIAEDCCISGIFNTRLCYSIFMPYNIRDFLLLSVLFGFFILIDILIINPKLSLVMVNIINYSNAVFITIMFSLLIIDVANFIPSKGRIFPRKRYKFKDYVVFLFELLLVICMFAYSAASEDFKINFISVFLIIIEILFIIKCYLSVSNSIYFGVDYDKRTTIKTSRELLRINSSKIKAEIKRIKQDSDEKQYNLESFDQDIIDIQKQIDIVTQEKTTKINEFENETKKKEEIKIERKYANEIKNKEELAEDIAKEQLSLARVLTKFENDYIIKYNTLLGGVETSLDNVNSIIYIIEHGRAKSLSEAIRYFKEEKIK